MIRLIRGLMCFGKRYHDAFERVKQARKGLSMDKQELESIGVDKAYRANIRYSKRKLFDRPGFVGSIIVTSGINSVFGYFLHFYLDEDSAHKGFAENRRPWENIANKVLKDGADSEDLLFVKTKNMEGKENLIYYFRHGAALVTILAASGGIKPEDMGKAETLLRKKLDSAGV